ncbi:hypothetical protein [Streptomyces sp. RFCAC02]|uniref:hypothetical protein n=1 Tax=Streptomyces sp. RFCAC02 TaxID=2499143 RepID=UPI00143D2942|nr:hypothetical protein [Streptomyces sp. RFCAC02]
MSCYAESPRLFVLLAADKKGTLLGILPKQGLDGADVAEPLRAILDRHLRRA